MKYIILFFILFSCATIIQVDQAQENQLKEKSKSAFSIIYSHNINGETEPCGCRNFPLGGLASVYGALEKEKQHSPFVLVDVGDLFFKTNQIPESRKESFVETAKMLSRSLNQLEYQFLVPGDQDFALGLDFYHSLVDGNFQVLLTNSKTTIPLKTKRWEKVEKNGVTVYLASILNPTISPAELSPYLTSPIESLKNALKEIKKDIKSSKIKNYRLILLSHSGIDYDRELVKKIKDFHWIIGAHSQSFTTFPEDHGKTKIVQVLNRNHYLGKIIISSVSPEYDRYERIEINENIAHYKKPNPFFDRLAKHRSKMSAIHQKEMTILTESPHSQSETLPTQKSCVECHDGQEKFHQKHPHSLAFVTLVQKEQNFNPSCINCHSVHYGKKGGFQSIKNIIKPQKKIDHKAYWEAFQKTVYTNKSVRSLSSQKLTDMAETWKKLDQEFQIKENYANVQCLNCHEQKPDHIYNETQKINSNSIQQKCLSCHDPDQSPSWYSEGKINNDVFIVHYKKMTCPKE